MLIGIVLVLLASALNAAQNVFEEKLLKAVGGAEVDPLELVGWEVSETHRSRSEE